MKRFSTITTFATGLLALASAIGATAATITVPTMQPNIGAAIAAANTGDEIRVQNTFVESGTASNTILSKAITIRSYDSTYTTPTSGAQWLVPGSSLGTTSGIIVLNTGASITLDLFAKVGVTGTNFIYVPTVALLGTSCSVTVTNTTFDNTPNTTATTVSSIKLNASSDSNVTVTNCNFIENGPAIVCTNINGVNTATVTGCSFTASAHGGTPLEFRTGNGTHTANVSRCVFTESNNVPLRVFCFFATSGDTFTTVNYDRCQFIQNTTSSNTFVTINGIANTVNAGSFCNVNATNCIFDLRTSATTASGITGLSQASSQYRADVTAKQCTFLVGSASQSAIAQLSNNLGTYTLQNCIVDGPGIAIRNDGLGMMTSGKNLFNVTTVACGANTANITLSGSEISGSPQFVSSSDFHLQNSSPAINIGPNLGVSVDYDGNPRPVGGGTDLGAYENQAVTEVSNWMVYSL